MMCNYTKHRQINVNIHNDFKQRLNYNRVKQHDFGVEEINLRIIYNLFTCLMKRLVSY